MPITLDQLIDLFQRETTLWDPERTVDTLKWGHADAAIDTVAVTMMATPAVIARAAELGAQLLVTHEPTFHDHLDQVDDETDPVVVAKRALLDRHGIAVWRCHDAVHRLQPDGIQQGMALALGWEALRAGDGWDLFRTPAPTLAALVTQIGERLGIAGIRWIGDPDQPVGTVALSCGAAGRKRHLALLRRPGVDVLVCGEQREWETCEYVRDANQLGRPCGLVVLGHLVSEERGMLHLADWLRSRLPGVAVHAIAAGDPFRHA